MAVKYYDLSHILLKNAHYNLIIGERSNGKTFAVLKYGLKRFCALGEQMAIVRRFSEDFTGKRGQTMFAAIEKEGLIAKYTKGEWNGIYYYSSRWYLCRYVDGKREEVNQTPLAYGFSLSSGEHDKSTSYPGIKTILFDEFLSRTGYLKDEFVLFMNVISTIARQRKDIKIFLCGNTVNKYCPYFKEMGLQNISRQKQGTIDVYKYGNTSLRVAVEYCKPNEKGKPSDILFAFNNPKLQMVTTGSWEVDIYPHCPERYRPCDIIAEFFVIWEENILHCEIVYTETQNYFIFIHPKTTPIKNPDTDIIFTTEYSHKPNQYRRITKPSNKFTQKIAELFKQDRVFYSDNETGEIMRNYLMWCLKG